MTWLLLILLLTADPPTPLRIEQDFPTWLACERVRQDLASRCAGVRVVCASRWPCDPGGLTEPDEC